jgi:prephenate dehydrogenase
MKRWNQVAIVGVGLIGGSIGLALRQRKLADIVVGVGRRAASLRKAVDAGAVTATTCDVATGADGAELVVVCTPIASIAGYVQQAATVCRTGALITDAGSTKAEIVRKLNGSLPDRAAFVGSHPLAGSEKNGPDNARADLFEGRMVIITPTRNTSDADLNRTADFWSSLGASVTTMSPEEHDRALAATSHLPHLVAAALARITSLDDLPMTAGGWRDTTRIAAGDPELWTQILSHNQDNVLEALEQLENSLAAFRTGLKRGDSQRLLKLLTEAKRVRDALGN